MKRDIEQWPKNKDFTHDMLSAEQIYWRKDVVKKQYTYGESKRCKNCGKEQPICEFYVKDKSTGRRSNKCRDCEIKAAGVVEIGRNRFAKKILKKKFRKCSICKNIMPIFDFIPSKNKYDYGFTHTCKECNHKLHKEFINKQWVKVGDFICRQYAKRVYGINKLDADGYAKIRAEILKKREAKYFLDDQEFVTLESFAKYVQEGYGLPYFRTVKRIQSGYSEIECTIPEKEIRSLKSGTNKGKIKVTDTITKEVFIFKNTKDAGLLKMFGSCTINYGIKTKIPVGGKRSFYKNPCLIERLEK